MHTPPGQAPSRQMLYVHDVHCLVACSLCVCGPLGHDQSLQILALLHLHLDLLNDFGQVRGVLHWLAFAWTVERWNAYLFCLGPLVLGQKLVGYGALCCLANHAQLLRHRQSYLESTAQAEDTVVGFLGRQTLEGELDGVVLLGDQVIGSAEEQTSVH